jgi:hypothetical protein
MENPDSTVYCPACGMYLVSGAAVPVPIPENPHTEVFLGTQQELDIPSAGQEPLPVAPAPYEVVPPAFGTGQIPAIPAVVQTTEHNTEDRCERCGTPLSVNDPFCSTCGWKRVPAQPAGKPKKAGKKILAIACALVLLVAGSFGVYAALREYRYKKATNAFVAQDYVAAADLFEKLGAYKDAADYLDLSRNYILYNEGVALLDTAQHDQARDIFLMLHDLYDFSDSQELAQRCTDFLTYREAEDLYNRDAYYEAYNLYISLDTFEDAAQRAKDCIQEEPESAVIEEGAGYTSYGGSAITFVNKSPLTLDLVVKLYSEDTTYWGMIFVRYGQEVSSNIEVGTYYMEYTFGSKHNWFGPSDCFGHGLKKLIIQGDSQYSFMKNYIMTFTLWS